MRQAAAGVAPDVSDAVDALGTAFEAQPLQDLQVDYTALFLSPAGAAATPYASLWIAGNDPALAQETMRGVIGFYAEAGFEIDDDFRDLPDHIAAELEFLYALIFREARAQVSGDLADELAAIELRLRFVRLHFGHWVNRLTEAMRTSAQTGFYRALADVTERVISAEGA